MMKAIVKTVNRLRANLIRVNDTPKEDISKRGSGMRILTLVQRKSSTFEILLPFFSNTPAIGSSAYRGTAVIMPDNTAMAIPFIPELAPIICIIFSRSTHHTDTDKNRRQYEYEVGKITPAEGQRRFSNLRVIEPNDAITEHRYK